MCHVQHCCIATSVKMFILRTSKIYMAMTYEDFQTPIMTSSSDFCAPCCLDVGQKKSIASELGYFPTNMH